MAQKKAMEISTAFLNFKLKKGPWVLGCPGSFEFIFVIRCLVRSQGQTRCFGFATTTNNLDRFYKFDVCVYQFSFFHLICKRTYLLSEIFVKIFYH